MITVFSRDMKTSASIWINEATEGAAVTLARIIHEEGNKSASESV